jgi:3-dehydroquinate synthetase
MWQVPSQLALFGTIDDASFQMFTNILKRMHIPTASSQDLVHMNNFVQKMKTDKSSLHISLMLIRECAAQFGTLLPAPWTVIFCHPSNTAPIPTLES